MSERDALTVALECVPEAERPEREWDGDEEFCGNHVTELLTACGRRILELERERDEAREFGERAAVEHNKLLMNRITACVYCGYEYEGDTPSHAQLTEHISMCDKHPMHAAKLALAASQAEVRDLRSFVEMCAGRGDSGCVCSCAEATLAARPTSDSALREVVTNAVDEGFDAGNLWMTQTGKFSSAETRAAIVDRILGPAEKGGDA